MEYQQLGDSGVTVSRIIFGSWAVGGWLWGGTGQNDAVGAIHAAYDQGVTSIDTAPVYGQGLSEQLVGETIQSLPRDKVQLLTKFGMRWDLAKGDLFLKTKDSAGHDLDVYKYAGRESIIQECENSLRRLGTDYLDLYQQHWPDMTTPIDETMEAVQRLIEQGKVRAAGVCNYSVPQLEEAKKTLPLVSNQLPYSMVRRDIGHDMVPFWSLDHFNQKGVQYLNQPQGWVVEYSSITEHHLDSVDLFQDAIISIPAMLAKQEHVRTSAPRRA